MVELWERQKGESSKTFAWFKVYRDLQGARTLKKALNRIKQLSEKNNKSSQNFSNDKKIKFDGEMPVPNMNQLKKQSTNWNWKERCRAYDNYLDRLDREQKEEDYKQLEASMISAGEELVKTIAKNIKDLKYDDAKTTTISHALASAGKAFDSSVKNLRLLYGRSTENREEKVDADVNATANVHGVKEIKELRSDSFMEDELEFMRKLMEE